MIIDFDNFNTWPKEIKLLLKDKSKAIFEEKEKEMKSFEDGSYIENPVNIETYNEVKNTLESIIIKEDTIGYHCTRITSSNNIQKTGLKKLILTEYKQIVLNELEKMGLKTTKLEEIDLAFQNFINQRKNSNRDNMVWFTLNRSMIFSHGCSYLFKYFGGEVSRRALQDIEKESLVYLSKIGTPAVVEIQISIKDLQGYQKSDLCESLINYGIYHFVKNTKYSMECEGMIKKDVTYSQIRKIVFESDFERTYKNY